MPRKLKSSNEDKIIEKIIKKNKNIVNKQSKRKQRKIVKQDKKILKDGYYFILNDVINNFFKWSLNVSNECKYIVDIQYFIKSYTCISNVERDIDEYNGKIAKMIVDTLNHRFDNVEFIVDYYVVKNYIINNDYSYAYQQIVWKKKNNLSTQNYQP